MAIQTSINKTCFRIALLSLFFFTTLDKANAAARPGLAHYVGSGLAYSTLNHIFVNPAAVVDSPKVSLQGSYLLDPENIYASATFGMGTSGLGLSYLQNSNGSDSVQGAAAFRLNTLSIGTTVYSNVDFDNIDADISGTFDLSKFRLTIIGRGVNLGLDRLDVGVGIVNGPLTIGLDVKIPWDSGQRFENYLFDAGFAYSQNKFSLGAGYTFSYVSDVFDGGNFHAGASIVVGTGVALEAFYKPQTQEWASSEVVLGLRIQL